MLQRIDSGNVISTYPPKKRTYVFLYNIVTILHYEKLYTCVTKKRTYAFCRSFIIFNSCAAIILVDTPTESRYEN